NSDLEETDFDVVLKQRLTAKDDVFLQTSLAYSSGGNTAQYYNQSDAANDPFRFRDRQEPILIAGYHHEWSPGVHTLVLGSRLSSTLSVTNPLQFPFFLFKDADQKIVGLFSFPAQEGYRSELEIYSIEAQQIWQTPRQTMVVGT